MERIRFQDILMTLEGLDSWLEKLGICSNTDRIHQAIETVRVAQRGFERFRATKEPSKIGHNSTYHFGLVEALEFCDVFRAFEHERVEVLRPKLERILKGPFRPEEETTDNADARNVMFELALAALWRLRGADVSIGEPDVTLRLDGVPYFVECKRPFRETSIRANIREATRQLKGKLDSAGEGGSMGIVAISVSRILNPGTKIFKAPTEKSDLLGELLERMMYENKRHWPRSDHHPRVVAALFHASTPGVIEDKDLLTYMSSSAVMPFYESGLGVALLREKLSALFDESEQQANSL